MPFNALDLLFFSPLLLIVCADVDSNLGPGSDKRVWVLYSNICGFHANLDELAVADRIMRFWFVLSLKYPIAAISQSSISLALVAELYSYPGNGSVY